jgi:hypothetical protein
MHRKEQEFLDLQQGINSVYEYIRKFNYQAQYDTHHVETDKKKAELLREGLSLSLWVRLVLLCDLTFNALVSTAINQEGTYLAYLDAKKKRKRAMSGPSEGSIGGAPPMYRLVYTSPTGMSWVPPPPLQWDHHLPQQPQMLPLAPTHSL